MPKADSVHSTPPTNTSATDLESFAALAAAVSPMWHQAVIRLARSTDDLAEKMSLLLNEPGNVRENAGKVISMLIAYLDLISADPELEEEDREEVGDAEPSLGSFDRMTDQTKSWRGGGLDADSEQDDCDSEDCDPDEEKQQPPEMGGVA